MNISTLVDAIKVLVQESTGYNEFTPRASKETKQESLPNTGIFRVVVLGEGKKKAQGCDRYTDLVVVIVLPLSGGDSNKSNMDSAIETESLISDLADFAEDDTCISEEINSQISRESGRVVSTISFNVAYKLS